jgi:hypothetical protein
VPSQPNGEKILEITISFQKLAKHFRINLLGEIPVTRPKLDGERLTLEIQKRGVSVREAAAEMGIAYGSLLNATASGGVTPVVRRKILRWLEKTPVSQYAELLKSAEAS